MKSVQYSIIVCVVAIFLTGCGDTKEAVPASSSAQKPAADTSKGHAAHGSGPHEGTLADWGGGKYHVEFTVDHGKKEAVVYILGSDEKTPTPIKTDKVRLMISDPDIQVDLIANPLEGEAEGTSSRFAGNHDNLGIVQEYQGTISGEIEGTPYVGEFKEEPHGDE